MTLSMCFSGRRQSFSPLSLEGHSSYFSASFYSLEVSCDTFARHIHHLDWPRTLKIWEFHSSTMKIRMQARLLLGMSSMFAWAKPIPALLARQALVLPRLGTNEPSPGIPPALHHNKMAAPSITNGYRSNPLVSNTAGQLVYRDVAINNSSVLKPGEFYDFTDTEQSVVGDVSVSPPTPPLWWPN